MGRKIRILVADDHPSFAEGLCRLLGEESDLEVIAKAEDGEGAVTLADKLHPDVALIDVAMPKLGGIEAAKRIKATNRSIAVLMISAYDYYSYLLASLQIGASGYVLKSIPVQELINSIRTVNSGQSVFICKPLDKVFKSLESLQKREIEILRGVAKGKANRMIGKELHVSSRTIQSHLATIFRKLGVNSRTAAVVYAIREGWITVDDLYPDEY